MADGASPRRAPGAAKTFALFAVAALAAFSVRLALFTPVSLHGGLAYDDQYFVDRAADLAAGRWLGPYTQTTLMKGPGFPALVALSVRAGLSSTAGLALLHLVATALAGLGLARLARSAWPGLGLAALLALHPTRFTEPLLRLARDVPYPDLVAAALGLAALAVSARGRASRFALAVAGGLALAWAWLTREEGIWMVPGLALIVALLALRAVSRRSAAPAIAIVAGALAGFLALHAALRWRNAVEYGAAVGVEFNAAEFRRALGDLQRVESGGTMPYVPVTRAARERIYAESPAFAELREFLDPPSGPVWQYGCPVYPSTCGEIGGGWFVWALREAAWKAGKHASPATARAYYAELAREVEGACDSGRLRCLSAWTRGLPRLQGAPLSRAGELMRSGVALVVLDPPPALDASPSDGPRPLFEASRHALGYPLVMPLGRTSTRFEVRGRWSSRDGTWPAFAWIDRDGRRTALDVQRVGGAAPAGSAFRLFTPREPRGRLLVRSGRAARVVRVRELFAQGGVWRVGRGTLRLAAVLDLDDPALDDPRVEASRRVRARLLDIYGALLRPLLAAGLLALPAAFLRWRRGADGALLGAAAVLWTLVLSRLLLLALVDLTAFPAMTSLYIGPAPTLAVAAAVAGLAAALAPPARDQSRDGMSSRPPRKAMKPS